MQVEDHPVSYFDFEGIIPSGNYGAGTVMVWDVGTWEPEGDAHAMLAKGDFKFRLDGEKLKGSFALIHIRSRRSGNKGTEWLLIKHRDAYAQEPYDIDEYDYSALTKRTLDQIADDAGAREWKSSRPAAAGGRSAKNDWLAESIAKADAAKRKTAAKPAKSAVAKKTALAKASSAKKSVSTAGALKKKSLAKKRLSR
jgi:bifunctional non-homologous end joining protein LigD